MKRLKAYLLLILLLPTVGESARAQWQHLGTFDGYLSDVYFVNWQYGFVGLGVGPGGPISGTAAICRTSDGGITWTQSVVPAISGSSEVTSILMEDSLHGWATVITTGAGGLWQTVNGGVSWTENTLTASGCTSVSRTPAALVVTDIFGATHISTDDGQTFNSPPVGTRLLDAQFTDGLHGVATALAGNHWATTSDGGLTWLQSNTEMESWSVYAVAGASDFYAAPEAANGSIYQSKDNGASWTIVGSVPFRTTGHIFGSSDTLLWVQESGNGNTPPYGNGVSQSTNQGKTWTPLQGPVALTDSRFTYVTGCNGNYLYAFDNNVEGSVYRYLISAPSPQLAASPNVLGFTNTLPCSISDSVITITNAGCSIMTIESLKLVKNTEFQLRTTTLPVTLAPDSTFIIIVHYAPGQSLTAADSLIINAIALGKSFTTGILLQGTLGTNGLKALLHPSVDSVLLNPVKPCSVSDSIVTLTNNGCGPIALDSISLKFGRSFFLDPISFPITLQSDSSLVIHFGFNTNPGATTDSILVSASVDEIPVTESIGIGTSLSFSPPVPSLNPSAIAFPTLTNCSPPDSIVLNVQMPSCDSVECITSLNGDPIFSAPSTLDSSVAGSSTIAFKVMVTPGSVGNHSGALTIRLKDLRSSLTFDTTLSVSSTIIKGSAILYTSLDSVNFGSRTVCDIPDTTIILTNAGCTPIHITNAQFSNPAFLVSGRFLLPDTLLPGKSDTISIVSASDTTGHPTIQTGTLTLTSDADSALAPIKLERAILYPSHVSLIPSFAVDSGSAGNAAQLQLTHAYDILPAGTTGIDFSLVYNGDVLTYAGANPASINHLGSSTLPNGHTESDFRLSPIPPSGNVESLTFKVALTTSSFDTIQMTNLSLEPPPASTNCLSLSDTGAVFKYVFACGDPTLQQYLAIGKLAFAIQSISPNPTSGILEIGVRYQVSGVEGIEYELDDALGKIAKIGSITATSAHIDLSSIASGSYYLRLSQNGFVQTRRVVVER